MAGGMQYAEDDPRHHPAKMKVLLAEITQHARDEVVKISDARTQALSETTAEVLGGLEAAYDNYEKRSEAAWRQGTQGVRTQGRQE
jgi:hypothetical protein